jgi:hypothetical protein
MNIDETSAITRKAETAEEALDFENRFTCHNAQPVTVSETSI